MNNDDDFRLSDLVEVTEDQGTRPARRGKVLAALRKLAQLDEAEILDLACEGRLAELFPFQFKESDEPLRLPTWEEVAARPEPSWPTRSKPSRRRHTTPSRPSIWKR